MLAALRYRVVDLYGIWPEGLERPAKPVGYDELTWAPMPDPVPDLEAELRGRMARAASSPPALAAHHLGWLFSGWTPDR